MEIGKTDTAKLISLLEKAAKAIDALSKKDRDVNIARACRVMRSKIYKKLLVSLK